jgi:hypothetical protein
MALEQELLATTSGQVTSELGSREIYEVIRERFENRRDRGAVNTKELLEEVRRLMSPAEERPVEHRVTDETRTADLITRKMFLETEPGIKLQATLLTPRGEGRKPGVLVVETDATTPSALATEAVRQGAVVLALAPRGLPRSDDRRPFGGDYAANTRAFLVGLNLPGMRAYDIKKGVDFLASRPEVDAGSIRGVARGEAGVWLLMAAAADPRIQRIWLDRTPYSLRAALDEPLNRNLHMAVMPGFCLKWDLADLVTAMEGRRVLWTDPTNWMRTVVPLKGNFRYRYLSQKDQPFLEELLQ